MMLHSSKNFLLLVFFHREILQAVLNFVLYKFGHLPRAQREWQIMHDLAKLFLRCLNHWKLETPSVKKQHSQGEDLAAYKVNYTR